MIRAYQATLLTRPPVLLGRRLCPFTLGHWRILTTFDSAFFGGGTITRDELIFAVWVCCQPDFQKAARTLLEGSFEREVRAWGRRAGAYDAVAVAEAFRAYLASYMDRPPRWEDANRKSKARAPGPFLYANALRHYYHLSESEAWNTPVHQAICDFATMGALLGDESLMTEEEARQVDALNAESETP